MTIITFIHLPQQNKKKSCAVAAFPSVFVGIFFKYLIKNPWSNILAAALN